MYSPWVRHIYIVTNGQIPMWLNTESDYINIITHSEIYPDQTDLPTFSSLSIETHLHRIKNLSQKYLYLNDDISFISAVCLSDFYSQDNGFKVYLQTGIFGGHPSPQSIFRQKCPSKCYPVENECRPACNRLACLYDGGNCDGIDNSEFEETRDPIHDTMFYKSIDYTNILMNSKLPHQNRYYVD